MIKKYQVFKESINKIIQNSNLDVGVVYFILKDILRDIEDIYYNQINMECIEEQKIQLNTHSKEEKSDEKKSEAEA